MTNDARTRTGDPSRHLRLAGTRNLRDVGGYPAGPGRVTRWRTLLRTDALDRLPETSQAHLLGLGIRQVIDLRWPSEVAALPSVFAGSAAVRYLTVPLLDNPPAPPEGLPRIYRRILDQRGSQLTTIVRAVLAPGGLPAIIGCAGGIDRTGVTVGLLLTAVGVPADVVAADYAMSATCFATDGRDAGLDDWRAGSVAVDCLPEYMIATLEHLETELGGAAGMLARHGVGADEIDELTDRLTEPAG
ncbi:MAG: 3,5-cyclic-AMP phosphodiesterase [Pseudonocardiales bacterium]|nr:3,5-cyclic-AMP phosphodiesterase [Pseudonocardiales bacterium]